MKIKGFTLAEVLITLGIVGVVAAITIPIITSRIYDLENIARWKKTYSVLHNAYNAVKAEDIELCATIYPPRSNKCSNGNPDPDLDTGYWNPEFMQAFLSKLKVVKTCGSGRYKFTDYTCIEGDDAYNWYCPNAGCYTSLGGKYTTITRDYAGRRPKITFKGADNSTSLWYYLLRGPQAVLLEDGTVLYFGGWPYGPWIIVDVNGWPKGPNMVGKDVFAVQLFRNKLVPSGAQESTGYNDPAAGASDCSKDIGLKSSIDFQKIAGAGCSYKYLLK